MRRNKADLLDEAISLVDLPSLILSYYPDSGALPGKQGLVFASWRGNENTKACSLSKVKGRWLWHDLATDEGGNAFGWLVQVRGMTKQEAATFLIDRAGLSPTASPEPRERPSNDEGGPTYRPLPPEAVEALSALPTGLVPPMKGRGFTPQLIEHYGIKADGNDALIPITSPEGVILQVKRRLAEPGRGGKYRYEHSGYGGPPWCSDNSREAPILLVVEGELSAIIAHAALQEAGHSDIGVTGVAGANSPLYPGLCSNKTVLVYADDDDAGEKAREAWAEKAHEDGAKAVFVVPPHRMDFCDHAGLHGIESLAEMLDAMRHSATQVYGAEDRTVGRTTVREIVERHRRMADGEVVHSTGLVEVDASTGGIREAGIYSIAGLSSMGKSTVMRRMLLAQLRAGGMVKVYSPDQPGEAIWRLIANQLSGVSWTNEVKGKRFSEEALRLYGDPKAAREAWFDTFADVLTHIAPRFQVSTERFLDKINKDMPRSVDEGVTMFAVDYLQTMVSTQGVEDGLQADEMQALAMSLKVPVLATLQLAKSKFPPTRVDGIPMPSDIEGSGAYYQSSEMVFMLYNDQIYGQRYAGEKWQPTGDDPGVGRLLLRKDKEGSGNEEWLVSWNPRLVTYSDYGVYDLARERKGLLS